MNNGAKTYLWENARLFYLLLYSIELTSISLSHLDIISNNGKRSVFQGEKKCVPR